MHTPAGQRQTLNSRLGRSSSAGVNLWARSEARRQRRAEADQTVTGPWVSIVALAQFHQNGSFININI